MTTLGVSLVWAAIQVSLVAILGVGFSIWLTRRNIVAASRITTMALGLVLILTALAFCPLPGWSGAAARTEVSQATDRNQEVPRSDADDIRENRDLGVAESSGRIGVHAPWKSWWQHLHRIQTQSAESIQSGSRWLAGVFVAGTLLCLSRMLLGLWAVSALRRQSRRVDDLSLAAMIEALRIAVGCKRSVGLRECNDLTSPATIGWRRPLILLPWNWRTWSHEEQRSVLAHEMAHIARGDYLAGLLACVAQAIYFYHPLVYWLGRQLRMQQELAADALGAQHSGGQVVYLKVLAQMALRQEGSTSGWLARAFLPAGGTLMRRIQMLRNREEKTSRPWTGRAAMAGLLVASLAVAGLRSPAQEKARDLHGASAVFQAQPFDLRFASPEGVGLVVMRPAAFLATPELKPLCQFIDKHGFEMLNISGWPAKAPSVADIEEVTLGIAIREMPDLPKGQQGAMITYPTMIRLVRPFDWQAYIKAGDKKFTLVKHADRVYYKAEPPIKGYLGQGLCFYIPDDRTLVIETEKNLKIMLDRPAGALPSYVSAQSWKHVQNGLMAIAFGNWEKTWTENTPIDKEPELAVIAGMKHASHFVCGIHATPTHIILDGIFDVADAGHAKELAENMKALFAKDHLSVKLASDKPRTQDEEVVYRLLQGLEQGTTVNTGKEGRGVNWHTEMKGSLIELAQILLREIAKE